MKAKSILIGAVAVGILTFAVVVAVDDYKHQDGFFTTTEKYREYTARADSDEEIIIRAVEKPKTAEISSEAEHEQEASEEEVLHETDEMGETVLAETEEVIREDAETVETETEVTLLRSVEQDDDGYVRWTIAGHALDREIYDFLHNELIKFDIEWWLPYALAQIFQESRFDPRAENKNGKDKGILQYRIDFWDWSNGDIFDYKAQISLYVKQTARRLSSGCSILETISRHNTSDYGTYNPEYVAQVCQWIAPE